MDFVILRNMPIYERKPKKPKWPWKTMDVGDFALIPVALHHRAKSSYGTYKFHHKEFRASCRRIDDATYVWTRIA